MRWHSANRHIIATNLDRFVTTASVIVLDSTEGSNVQNVNPQALTETGYLGSPFVRMHFRAT